MAPCCSPCSLPYYAPSLAASSGDSYRQGVTHAGVLGRSCVRFSWSQECWKATWSWRPTRCQACHNKENGFVAYVVYLWFLFILLGCTFDDDCSANLGLVWEAWLRGEVDTIDAVSTSCAQVLGGQLAFPYAKRLWRTAPTSRHGIKWQAMIQEQCSSVLHASLLGGVAAEALATLIYFAARKYLMPRGKTRSIAFDSAVQVVIIAIGLEWTGMMFNPALASALTFNCRNHPVGEHLLVYWVAPLATIAVFHAATMRGPIKAVTNGTKQSEAKSS